jgi:hypothetical protein
MPFRPRRPALLGAILALCAAVPAHGVDWSVSGFFSEQLAVDTRDTSEDDDDRDDVALRSLTDLGASIRARTKRADWLFAPGVRGVLSTDDSDEQSVLPRFNGSVRYAAPRHAVTGSVSVVPDFVSETQFDDTGLSEDNVLQFTLLANAGFSYSVNSRNTVELGADARARTFTEDTTSLEETQSFGLTAGWSTALTPRTTVSLTPGVQLFFSDAATSADGTTFSLVGGVEHRINPRLSVDVSLGPSYTVSTRDVPVAGGGFREEENADFGVTGGAGLSYATPRGSVSLSLSQAVDQNCDGDLENRTTLSIGLGRRLTPVSRVSLFSSFTVQTALSGSSDGDDVDRQTFSITPTYSIDLTEDWSLDASYRFRASNDDDFGVSNTVFVTISRGLSFLP